MFMNDDYFKKDAVMRCFDHEVNCLSMLFANDLTSWKKIFFFLFVNSDDLEAREANHGVWRARATSSASKVKGERWKLKGILGGEFLSYNFTPSSIPARA